MKLTHWGSHENLFKIEKKVDCAAGCGITINKRHWYNVYHVMRMAAGCGIMINK